MRAVVQRVAQASVTSMGEMAGSIEKGLCVLLGVESGDTEKDAVYMAGKIVKLRIFEDENEKMNLSVTDVEGSLLVISQFTLFGDCRKGRRPNFTGSCEPVKAEKMYLEMLEYLKNKGIKTESGIFGADMKVDLLNDGPVTLLLDSSKLF